MIHDDEKSIRYYSSQGLINFMEFREGIEFMLGHPNILTELVDKLISEKCEDVLNNIVKLLKIMMQG
jgi:hypothetical protein